MKECNSEGSIINRRCEMSKSGDEICSIWGVVRLVWSEGCVVRAVIEVIHQGQSEVSRGIVKYEGGKGYENNPGVSK